jgi:cardiolipin synthase
MPVPTSESKRVQWLDRRYTQSESQARRAGTAHDRREGEPGLCRLSIPNLITLARILLVPVLVWAIATERMHLAFLLFLVAAISDAVDGFLAKRFGMKTELGAYLDPLADKVLIVSIYVTLGITAIIPLWIVILVVSRDIMIVGAIILSWLVDRPVAIRPHVISKLNTAVQIAFACLVLASRGYDFDAEPVLTLVMALVAVLTLLSVGLYLAKWVRHMNSAEAGS